MENYKIKYPNKVCQTTNESNIDRRASWIRLVYTTTLEGDFKYAKALQKATEKNMFHVSPDT